MKTLFVVNNSDVSELLEKTGAKAVLRVSDADFIGTVHDMLLSDPPTSTADTTIVIFRAAKACGTIDDKPATELLSTQVELIGVVMPEVLRDRSELFGGIWSWAEAHDMPTYVAA